MWRSWMLAGAVWIAAPCPALATGMPGAWSAIRPLQPGNGPGLGVQVGSPRVFSISMLPGSLGLSIDLPTSERVIHEVAVESEFIGGLGAASYAPTLLVGDLAPTAVRGVIAPRLGIDHRDDWLPTFGASALLDAPLFAEGSVRGWLGGYGVRTGWGERVTAHAFALVGASWTPGRVELGLQIAIPAWAWANHDTFYGWDTDLYHYPTAALSLTVPVGRAANPP